ncbi:LysR substrate-binding domain-containing protein [Albidovulum sp.]|uniref:LysR substrate-binding domain-containing protein n=1 Tax=Albidovulum sp. TaxID=1872424 RepID=UPI0039B81E92
MITPRRKLPPLNALRAFEVAGRRLSFRAAADELGVTQGAVAQQVRALEDHLGLPLFLRLARGLALTPQGSAYLSDLTRAFDTLGEATGQLALKPGRVTISATPTVATRILIPRLAELRDALPGVELRTIADEALPDFDRDDVDIAIGLASPPVPATLEARLLIAQEIIAVASPRLVEGLSLPLDGTQIGTLPLLHHCQDHWPRFLDTRPPLPGPQFNLTTLALDAAIAGQGVAVAGRAFVAAELADGRLVQVMDRTLRVEPDYWIVRRRGAAPGSASDAVWAWCVERLGTG